MEIIERYDLGRRLPKSVLNHLNQGLAGHIPETPKPGDPIFNNVTNLIIGRNSDAIQAGVQQAVLEGFNADTFPKPLEGEARLAGEKLAAILQRMALKDDPLPRPACLIIGGETTVSLDSSGEIGKGGRNLEIALSAVKAMNTVPGVALITLATDGEDGETDAAGAVVTGDSYGRGRILQMDPETYLRNHNSYPYFQALDDLLLSGVTQTNVNDLCFLITL
jgi:hydroxypyruvate reductase